MAASKRTIRVGILAEDDSDVAVIRLLLSKMTPRRSFGVRSFVGHGCGKLRYKARVWASQLADRGCSILLLIHDLDREKLAQLRAILESALDPTPIRPYLIVIPIEELEAWLLSDANALRLAFHLKKKPKCPTSPELVSDPKRYLENLVWIASQKTKRYVNTIHNVRIAEHLGVPTLRKCKAFRPLEQFWMAQKVS